MHAPMLRPLSILGLVFCLAACGGRAASPSAAVPSEDAPAPSAARARDAPPAEAPRHASRSALGVARLQIDGDTERGGVHRSQRVKVRYRAWDAAGARVDGGDPEGKLATWLVMALPPGLQESVVDMGLGQTWRLWIPSEASFEEGDRVYEVQLLEVVERRVSGAPEDVAAPPPSAEVTGSGLASRVLEPGTGVTHPSAASSVTVHYTGWTTDGEMFDSSVTRGSPATFPLSRVIRGWTEGVPLMVPGEIRRFWIPAALAYGDNPRPGAPRGMLVFDVELMDIE